MSNYCKHHKGGNACDYHRASFYSFCNRTPETQHLCSTYEPEEKLTEEAAREEIEGNRGGKKFDKGKLRLDLIPTEAIKALGEVLTYGAGKYGDRNWEEGISYSRLYAATQRHLLYFWDGQKKDEESGLHPLWHALTDIAMLLWMDWHRNDLDDRPRVEE